MARRKENQARLDSPLARARVRAGLSRQELANAAGISYSSLKRLEARKIPNAPFWWYTNLVIALEVGFEDILDESDLSWRSVKGAEEPPPPMADWLEMLERRRQAG